MKSLTLLAPCGILGYGFPDASFIFGLSQNPDAIVVDAGSTDAGPHKLGAKTAIVSRMAAKQDLQRIILGGWKHKIPILVGSAGGSGGHSHVEWTLSIIDEILHEHADVQPKIAIIWADIPNQVVIDNVEKGVIVPCDTPSLPLTQQRIEETTGIVAQMGIEPILRVIEAKADIIICGRAYDPAPFAAMGVYHGFDTALSYHLGKVLECGALCCNPGTTKDCMLGTLYEDCFEVYPCNPTRRCTPVSVAAHTFYEKDHPYLLHGPGIAMDLSGCTFTQVGENRVRVTGSRLQETNPYQIKLEGARRVAYRTFVVAGIRDPILIEKLEEVQQQVVSSVKEQYKEVDPTSYTINFINYGKDGVMGKLEPEPEASHEIGVLFEVLANEQELANAICASVRSTFMHFDYEGRKSTAGNLAFPYAPSDIPFGPVYEFSVYHLMAVTDPCEYFPWQWWNQEVGDGSIG